MPPLINLRKQPRLESTFLDPSFRGFPSVIWLNTNAYLPFLFKQLQPVCPGWQLLWLPYQCLWQKAVEEDDSVCSAATCYNNPVRPSAVIPHKRKRVGRGPSSSSHHCWRSDIKGSFMPPPEWELGHQFVSVVFHMYIHESSSSCCSLSSHSLGKKSLQEQLLLHLPPTAGCGLEPQSSP